MQDDAGLQTSTSTFPATARHQFFDFLRDGGYQGKIDLLPKVHRAVPWRQRDPLSAKRTSAAAIATSISALRGLRDLQLKSAHSFINSRSASVRAWSDWSPDVSRF